MNQKCTNTSPTTDKDKWGPETPGLDHTGTVKDDGNGNHPNGESKKVGDATNGKHWSGH